MGGKVPQKAQHHRGQGKGAAIARAGDTVSNDTSIGGDGRWASSIIRHIVTRVGSA